MEGTTHQMSVFSRRPSGGNPARVQVMRRFPSADAMQRFAAELGESETAFVVPGERASSMRWFSARQEVHLCGHATMAAAFALRAHHAAGPDQTFHTCAGPLRVSCGSGDRVAIRLPCHEPVAVQPPAALRVGLGACEIVAVLRAERNFYAILPDERAVAGLRPHLNALARLHPAGVSVSAPGDTADMVSRFFAPSYGIPEDPASAHPQCALTPYWAERLGRTRISSRQLSERGGEIEAELSGNRVVVHGSVTSCDEDPRDRGHQFTRRPTIRGWS